MSDYVNITFVIVKEAWKNLLLQLLFSELVRIIVISTWLMVTDRYGQLFQLIALARNIGRLTEHSLRA